MPFLTPEQIATYNNISKYGENRDEFFSYDIELMDLRAAYADLLKSGDEELIAKVNAAIALYADEEFFLRVVQMVNGGIAFILMCLCILRIWELYEEEPFAKLRASGKWYVPFLLVLYNLSTVVPNFIDLFILDSNLSQERINLLWKVYTVGYVFGNWLLYVLLYLRCAAVLNTSAFASHVRIKQLQRTVKLILMVLGPLLIFFPFFAVYGVYVPDHSLSFHANPTFVYLFLIMDTLFSLQLLGLFIYPVMTLYQNVGEVSDEFTSIMRGMIKRNLVISSIAIVSTFISMVFSSQLDTLCNGLPSMSNLDLQWYRPLNHAIVSADMVINMTAAHFITTMWVPTWLQKKTIWDPKTAQDTPDEMKTALPLTLPSF